MKSFLSDNNYTIIYFANFLMISLVDRNRFQNRFQEGKNSSLVAVTISPIMTGNNRSILPRIVSFSCKRHFHSTLVIIYGATTRNYCFSYTGKPSTSDYPIAPMSEPHLDRSYRLFHRVRKLFSKIQIHNSECY